MMRIISNSQNLLCLYFERWGVLGTRCAFDRLKDEVKITDVFWIISLRRVTVPLSLITDANVQRFGEDGDKRYYLTLRLRYGRTLRISRLAKKEALNLLPAIQDFLKPECVPTP